MQNLMQKILHTKAFSVKLQSYGLYRLILTLECLVLTKGHTYYVNKPATLSMYDLLLPPGIKRVNRAAQMPIICCTHLHRLQTI